MLIGLTKFKTSQTYNNFRFLEENEFYKGESNCELIVIVVGGLGRGKALQASPSRQVFPSWEPFSPTNFFPLPMKVLVLPIVIWNGTLKSNKSIKIWTIKWVNSQWNFKSFVFFRLLIYLRQGNMLQWHWKTIFMALEAMSFQNLPVFLG